MHEGHHGILDDLEDMDDLFGSEEELDENGDPLKIKTEKQDHSHDHKHDHAHKDDHDHKNEHSK